MRVKKVLAATAATAVSIVGLVGVAPAASAAPAGPAAPDVRAQEAKGAAAPTKLWPFANRHCVGSRVETYQEVLCGTLEGRKAPKDQFRSVTKCTDGKRHRGPWKPNVRDLERDQGKLKKYSKVTCPRGKELASKGGVEFRNKP